MTQLEIEFYKAKLSDKHYMEKAVVDCADRFTDAIIKRGACIARQEEKKEKEVIMQNKLEDLNNHLFEQIERLQDDEVCHDMMSIEAEVAKSGAISKLAQGIIDIGNLQLNAIKIAKDDNMRLSIPNQFGIESR